MVPLEEVQSPLKEVRSPLTEVLSTLKEARLRTLAGCVKVPMAGNRATMEEYEETPEGS